MKKIYLIISIALVCISASAQFAENWSKQYQTTTSSNFSNEGRKVVSDANSNVFVLGDYSSDNDSAGHHVSTTQYSVRIHKYNFQGNLLTWAYIPVNGLINNGYDNKSGFGLELDASGNVYVGYSILNAAGNFDVVIANYSNNLVKNWAKSYSTGNNDAGVDLKLIGNTAIALVQSVNPGNGNTTFSVVKATTIGTTASLIYSFSTNLDVVNALAVNSSKNFYLTGYSIVSGSKVAMTASVSTSGLLKWKSTFNHGSVTGDDFGSKLVLGTDGYIYVIGTTYTSAANGTDGLAMKYNTSGIMTGVLFLHASAADVGGTIVNGPTNYIFAACSNTNTAYVHKIQTNGLFAVVTSASYLPLPSNAYSSITKVSIEDIKVATSNNVYICGTITGTTAAGNFSSPILAKFGLVGFLFKLINSQPFTADNGDNYRSVNMGLDGYKLDILWLRNEWGAFSTHASEYVNVVDLDGGASLRLSQDESAEVTSSPQISIYPNPASSKIVVSASEKISSVELCDLTGKVVLRVNPDALIVEISVADLNNGLYICKTITANGESAMKRLMIN